MMTIAARLGPLLTAAALCVILGSNITELRATHAMLETVNANQRSALTNAGKVEAQLDSLARGTEQLAQSGNPNATRIVGILQANGVRINAR